MGTINVWQEATVVMLIGMGVVFSFLIVMVSVMTLMRPIMAFLNKMFPEEIVAINKTKKSISSTDDEIAAAIAIAISR